MLPALLKTPVLLERQSAMMSVALWKAQETGKGRFLVSICNGCWCRNVGKKCSCAGPQTERKSELVSGAAVRTEERR